MAQSLLYPAVSSTERCMLQRLGLTATCEIKLAMKISPLNDCGSFQRRAYCCL